MLIVGGQRIRTAHPGRLRRGRPCPARADAEGPGRRTIRRRVERNSWVPCVCGGRGGVYPGIKTRWGARGRAARSALGYGYGREEDGTWCATQMEHTSPSRYAERAQRELTIVFLSYSILLREPERPLRAIFALSSRRPVAPRPRPGRDRDAARRHIALAWVYTARGIQSTENSTLGRAVRVPVGFGVAPRYGVDILIAHAVYWA